MRFRAIKADLVLASVAWGLVDDFSPQDIGAAKAALVIHMRKKHPGKKFQVVRDRSPDRTENALFAVLLDG